MWRSREECRHLASSLEEELELSYPKSAAVSSVSGGKTWKDTFQVYLLGRCPGKSSGPMSRCVLVGLFLLHPQKGGEKVLRMSFFPHMSGI